MKMTNLVWNVYKENVNRNCIEIYNVFDHVGFRSEMESVIEEFSKKVDDIESDISEAVSTAREKVRMCLFYYFYGKTEYEIMLTAQIVPERFPGLKISIYDQVELNFDSFFEYIIRTTIIS